MGRAIAVLLVTTMCAAAWVVSPFVAAWTLREAIKAGDVATIERKVIWPTVRTSLRDSLAADQSLSPEAASMAERVKPSLWQRVKTAFGQSMLDRFIESYVTPEGLPKLMRYRAGWNGAVKGQSDVDDEDKLDMFERAKAFYRRMHRAEFSSPTRIEIEMSDRFSPDRRYVSVMEWHGFEWKLAELRIIGGLKQAGLQTARGMMGLQ